MSKHQNNFKKPKWNISIAIPQWLTAGAVLTSYFFLHSEIGVLSSKLDAEVRAQNQRSDQLYMMFVDLLKEGRK